MLMAKSKVKGAFKLHDRVVYPLQGVGQVIEIIDMEFKGEVMPYYVMYFAVSDMTVKVPVDKARGLGIRGIVPKKEAKAALELFTEAFEPIPTDWKMRYQMNLELLKQGSIRDIATVVRALYQRKKVKELPIMERKLYDSALQLLVDEVSFSMKLSRDEVRDLVYAKLEVEQDHTAAVEDDEFDEDLEHEG